MCNREDNFLLAQRPFDEKGPDNNPPVDSGDCHKREHKPSL